MKAVRPPPPASAGPAPTSWRARLDDLQHAVGPLPRRLLGSWRLELDAVQSRVASLQRASGPLPTDGVHALLALAGARLGRRWDTRQLIDAAAAVELADRAIRWHGAVRDGPPGNPRRHVHNITQVLGGDLAITRAALLVAEIGPDAYRLLVRGYGAAQLSRLAPMDTVGPTPLHAAALALGALVAGVDDVRLPSDPASPVHRAWRWALASGVDS